ncbi:OmpA family protein [Salinimicrobium sp. MT39]|uniref:OmpA family protein n=1 Tax=Salinimicrobium profundisediminis TaxID=2994553 RepID=A0A9X3CZG4_9FLAO|nr:OmpA family protein [Salinimicrobium profundisediminis]MCX2838494.1 OmpA family protein [Salinimicrobium profundisediminis]
MIKNFKYLYIILFLFAFLSIEAQESKLDKAERQYENYGYINAREIYLKVAQKGFESEELFQRLGNSYYFNAAYEDALVWYKKLFALNSNQEEEYLRRYAQCLQAVGESKNAKKIYNLFEKHKELSVEDYAYLIDQNSGRYSIDILRGVNTDGREFGHTFQNGKLIYASTQDTSNFIQRNSSWDGLNFLNLYEVQMQEDSTLSSPKKLKGIVNGKYHESSAAITKDGQTLYFTGSNRSSNKPENQNLKIYRAHLKDGKWEDLEDLAINIEGYSTAHPALDKEEKLLYFTSNRPGGYGESDIYRTSINTDGSLNEPENLGSKINTKGKETFPFVSDENELYFSSDGHYGLGGLDVFYVKMEDSGFSNILNVGRPVNSYADDFSFGINSDSKMGFFSSNRTHDRTFELDNIYVFKEDQEIIDGYKSIISGRVIDEDGGKPLMNATIKLYNGEALLDSTSTDAAGNYSIAVNYFDIYRLQAAKENYDAKEKWSEDRAKSQEINFSLKRNILALTPGTDISSLLNIKYILFDFDRTNIRDDAEIELEKLLAVMQEYPELKIEIRSHTDSRGADAYNKLLSERRALSTKQYLVDKGIDKQRLSTKGLGEERLLNNCGNDENCPAEEHQKNRRSEFVIKD